MLVQIKNFATSNCVVLCMQTMDIGLLEEKMEESIKHIYELNSVIRMSLIEMQFIKKVTTYSYETSYFTLLLQ